MTANTLLTTLPAPRPHLTVRAKREYEFTGLQLIESRVLTPSKIAVLERYAITVDRLETVRASLRQTGPTIRGTTKTHPNVKAEAQLGKEVVRYMEILNRKPRVGQRSAMREALVGSKAGADDSPSSDRFFTGPSDPGPPITMEEARRHMAQVYESFLASLDPEFRKVWERRWEDPAGLENYQLRNVAKLRK